MIQKAYLPLHLHFWWRAGIHLVSTWFGSFAGMNERPTMTVGQLNYFLKCSAQLASRRFWEWISVLSDSLINSSMLGFREPVLLVSRWCLRLLPIATAFSNSLHLPIHRYSRSFLKLLASWHLKDLYASLYVESERTDLPASNSATEIEDIHRRNISTPVFISVQNWPQKSA